jgi:hypothetical protein
MYRRPGADRPLATLKIAALATAVTAAIAATAMMAFPVTAQPAGNSRLVFDMAAASPFTYASGTRHYRITSVDTRTQNQSGGRAPFEFTTTTTQFVTLTLSPRTRDTLALALTLDSVGVSSTLDAPPATTEGLRGARMEGTISPQGKTYVFAPAPGETNHTKIALYRAFSRFLAAVPPQLAAGTTWTDTTTESFKRGEFDIKTSTVTTSKVAGDTTVAGQHAWRVERNGVLSTTGEGVEKGIPIHLSADGTIRSVQLLGQTGVFLGSTGTQSTHVEMSMNESSGGESQPIQEVIKSTVEALPGQ